MPGVPSGRGCDGCRKQKKKCDQGKPSCTRCARLGIECVGSGEQRYLFKSQQCSRRKPLLVQAAASLHPLEHHTIVRVARNDLDSLVHSFIEIVGPATELRFNLAWSYGDYLHSVPQRLGLNKSLDAAASAVVSAHSDYCSKRQVTTATMLKHSHALITLRASLDDHATARSTETLCAVMLLLSYQGLVGTLEGRWTGHCEGAAQLLMARKQDDTQDPLEKQLLMTVRGPLLFEGFLNANLQYNAQQWKDLVAVYTSPYQPANELMRCVAEISSIMCRWRAMEGDASDKSQLVVDARGNYESLLALAEAFREQYRGVQNRIVDEETIPIELTQALPALQRLYGIVTAVVIIMSCVYATITDSESTKASLKTQRERCVGEILALAQSAAKYRPLGASYMPLSLGAAWLGTDTSDSPTRSLIEAATAKYLQDHPSGGDIKTVRASLEWTAEQFHLKLHGG